MSTNFTLPPIGFGPGSQPSPEDGQELDYMPMPSGMRVFEPRLPDVDDPEKIQAARALMRRLAEAAAASAEDGARRAFDLAPLDPVSRRLVSEIMGEGEVSVIIDGKERIEAQESVFAGVWLTRSGDREAVEVGAAPAAIDLFQGAALQEAAAGPGVVNAPAIVTELLEAIETRAPDDEAHVVNLTLLPHTPEDLAYLDAVLGRGPATILSRGYGNCRIEQAARRDVWRVRYFNSQDALILDTIEVCALPGAALAAAEDLRDSAERLREVEEALS